MPIHLRPPLPRRQLLKGVGVTLALPLLEAMLPRRAAAAGSSFTAWQRSKVTKPRAIFCYVPNGKNIFAWFPKDTGPNYQLSPTLAPLAEHRQDFTVVSGLEHAESQGGHSGADTWLTGANLRSTPGTDYSNTVSVDQLVADKHGRETRFPFLALSDCSGTGSPGHSFTLSFDALGTPLPAENSPVRVFDRLFGADNAADRVSLLQQYAKRRSILDSVLGEAKTLQRRLGSSDQHKVNEYLTSVRATEARFRRLESWVDVPKAVVDPSRLQLGSQPISAHDRAMWMDVMLELSYLAFVTDTTRVITFLWSRESGGFGGGGEDHHELSHHGGDKTKLDKLAGVDRFHVEKLARFIGLLKNTAEADGTMLDRTMVVYGCGMNSGEGGEHSPHDLPLLVAGGQQLGLKHGQHLRFGPAPRPPLANVLLTVAQKMGLESPRFRDSTGTLSGLI